MKQGRIQMETTDQVKFGRYHLYKYAATGIIFLASFQNRPKF